MGTFQFEQANFVKNPIIKTANQKHNHNHNQTHTLTLTLTLSAESKYCKNTRSIFSGSFRALYPTSSSSRPLPVWDYAAVFRLFYGSFQSFYSLRVEPSPCRAVHLDKSSSCSRSGSDIDRGRGSSSGSTRQGGNKINGSTFGFSRNQTKPNRTEPNQRMPKIHSEKRRKKGNSARWMRWLWPYIKRRKSKASTGHGGRGKGKLCKME